MKREAPYTQTGEGSRRIQAALLDWFARAHRSLPWRETRDPYRIWVSEVMLQQTRVETVIPYYRRFLERFPTVQHLAEAGEDEVLKLWEGLGYYSRARNLQRGARQVVERFGGEVPRDPKEIRSLAGVGPYTAGAIASIAFGLPEPAVDGNVMRVVARLFEIADDVTRPQVRRGMEELVRTLIPKDAASPFNQALMELGALICTPTSPKCRACPLQNDCQARERGTINGLPVKGKRTRVVPVQIAAAFVERAEDGKWLAIKRSANGLLANMWALPSAERHPDEDWEEAASRAVRDVAGLDVEVLELLGGVEHVFTHRRWDLRAYRCRVVGQRDGTTSVKRRGVAIYDQGGRQVIAGAGKAPVRNVREERARYRAGGVVSKWVSDEEWDALTLPVAFRRLLEQIRSDADPAG